MTKDILIGEYNNVSINYLCMLMNYIDANELYRCTMALSWVHTVEEVNAN